MGYASILARWIEDLDKLYTELVRLDREIESFNHFKQPHEVQAELKLARDHVYNVFQTVMDEHARAVKAEAAKDD